MLKNKLLIINASLGGKNGNSFKLFEPALKTFRKNNPKTKVTILHLGDNKKQYQSISFWKKVLQEHHAYFVLSGTYWDSWSSHLQNFLELTTPLECDPCFFGKPIGALISMHSVGGKEVLSRLLGVFSTQGYLIAPQTSLVLSLASELALELEKKSQLKNFSDDFWSKDEIPDILERLMSYAACRPKNIKPWAVDKKDPRRIWAKLLNE